MKSMGEIYPHKYSWSPEDLEHQKILVALGAGRLKLNDTNVLEISINVRDLLRSWGVHKDTELAALYCELLLSQDNFEIGVDLRRVKEAIGVKSAAIVRLYRNFMRKGGGSKLNLERLRELPKKQKRSTAIVVSLEAAHLMIKGVGREALSVIARLIEELSLEVAGELSKILRFYGGVSCHFSLSDNYPRGFDQLSHGRKVDLRKAISISLLSMGYACVKRNSDYEDVSARLCSNVL
jgi:hypothetical protein